MRLAERLHTFDSCGSRRLQFVLRTAVAGRWTLAPTGVRVEVGAALELAPKKAIDVGRSAEAQQRIRARRIAVGGDDHLSADGHGRAEAERRQYHDTPLDRAVPLAHVPGSILRAAASQSLEVSLVLRAAPLVLIDELEERSHGRLRPPSDTTCAKELLGLRDGALDSQASPDVGDRRHKAHVGSISVNAQLAHLQPL